MVQYIVTLLDKEKGILYDARSWRIKELQLNKSPTDLPVLFKELLL